MTIVITAAFTKNMFNDKRKKNVINAQHKVPAKIPVVVKNGSSSILYSHC